MSYLTPAPDTRYMICFHVVQIPGPDIVTLDRTLPPLIPVYYMTYSWLSLLRGLDYYIITIYLVLLNSYTPELLYTWTPEIGRLLTFSWYYTLVDPRNRITMNIDYCEYPVDIITGQILILDNLHRDGETGEYRYSLHVYDGLIAVSYTHLTLPTIYSV